jgi:hypothetical protein
MIEPRKGVASPMVWQFMKLAFLGSSPPVATGSPYHQPLFDYRLKVIPV